MSQATSIGSDHHWRLNFAFPTKLSCVIVSLQLILNKIIWKVITAILIIRFFKFLCQCGQLSKFTFKIH